MILSFLDDGLARGCGVQQRESSFDLILPTSHQEEDNHYARWIIMVCSDKDCMISPAHAAKFLRVLKLGSCDSCGGLGCLLFTPFQPHLPFITDSCLPSPKAYDFSSKSVLDSYGCKVRKAVRIARTVSDRELPTTSEDPCPPACPQATKRSVIQPLAFFHHLYSSSDSFILLSRTCTSFVLAPPPQPYKSQVGCLGLGIPTYPTTFISPHIASRCQTTSSSFGRTTTKSTPL